MLSTGSRNGAKFDLEGKKFLFVHTVTLWPIMGPKEGSSFSENKHLCWRKPKKKPFYFNKLWIGKHSFSLTIELFSSLVHRDNVFHNWSPIVTSGKRGGPWASWFWLMTIKSLLCKQTCNSHYEVAYWPKCYLFFKVIETTGDRAKSWTSGIRDVLGC